MTKPVGQHLHLSIDDRVARINLGRWAMACEEMLIRIVSGRHDDAHAVLRRFCAGEIPQYCTMSSHPSQALPPRLANLLEAEGYHNMTAIYYASDNELLEINGMGQESISYIRTVLKRLRSGEPVAVVEDASYLDYLRGDG
jgi:hypothetical protein